MISRQEYVVEKSNNFRAFSELMNEKLPDRDGEMLFVSGKYSAASVRLSTSTQVSGAQTKKASCAGRPEDSAHCRTALATSYTWIYVQRFFDHF